MQSTSTVFMIRPKWFGSNPETASTNVFQKAHDANLSQVLEEFDHVVFALQNEGVEVLVYEDQDTPKCPDAIFPNNWIGVHQDKNLVIYPMMAANRRQEKRADIINDLALRLGNHNMIDLSFYEAEEKYLEGTGSLIFDHLNKIVYAALSQRTHKEPAKFISDKLGYNLVFFETSLSDGVPIYHTNVIMSIGTDFVVVASDLIEQSFKKRVLESLESSGREIIEITKEQAFSFAANVLELNNSAGEKLLVISNGALDSLNALQISAIQKSCLIVPVPISLIEQIGGGGVRCMLTEIFN